MSIIPFMPPQKKKEPEKTPTTSFCLTSNGFSYGSMFIEDGAVSFVLINLSTPINLSNTQVIGGVIKDPEFPMIYDEGNPIPFLLGDNESLRTTAYDIKEGKPIGSMTILMNENDLKDRVNIFLQRMPPYDLDGFMWGIDHVYIDCKDCPVCDCPSRGTLPWKEEENKNE